MEKVIKVGDSVAIVTRNLPRCPKEGEEGNNINEGGHDFSETVFDFHNDERTLTQEEYFALSEEERNKLSISTGQGRCVKCGIKYLEYDNPNYL